MAKLIDGKALAQTLRAQVKEEIAQLKEQQGITPGLAVVILGDPEAAKLYVGSKQKACDAAGVYSESHVLPEETKQEELFALIDRLNADEKINGILIQLPLPAHIDAGKVLDRISPEKDVDAFHPDNIGRLSVGNPRFVPCTPNGVMELLRAEQVELEGRNCVVVGSSNIVGKPMGMLLLSAKATVTVCNIWTKNLADYTRRADVLIVAIGDPRFITADYIKEGAVVIDVGINRDAEGKVCGDIDFASVEPKCSAITPVPGGVGPMTVAMLLKSTLEAAKAQHKAHGNA